MPRPTIEAATPIPALLAVLRELEGVPDDGVVDAVGLGDLVDVNAEDDATCLVRDCGGGA